MSVGSYLGNTSITKANASLSSLYQIPGSKIGRGLSLFSFSNQKTPSSKLGKGILSATFFSRSILKRKRKKEARRRYRMFIDNVIIHHRRIHDKNTEVMLEKIEAISRTKKKNNKPNLSRSMSPKGKIQNIGRSVANDIENIKNRIEAKRARAISIIKTISYADAVEKSKERSRFAVRTL